MLFNMSISEVRFCLSLVDRELVCTVLIARSEPSTCMKFSAQIDKYGKTVPRVSC